MPKPRPRTIAAVAVAVLVVGSTAFALVRFGYGGKPAAKRPALASPPEAEHAKAPPGKITISGTVIDAHDRSPVAGVAVEFLRDGIATTAISNSSGVYSVTVAPGTYRAYVRDEHLMSVSSSDHVRTDFGPLPETANAPDESLMPRLVATTDVSDIDLTVRRAGTIHGRVTDDFGQPIEHAIVRARGTGERPVLGTDIAESNANGDFDLRVPPGRYALDASHPRFATMTSTDLVPVDASSRAVEAVSMSAGCVITGRVLGVGQTVASDGAFEKASGTASPDSGERFVPAGRVDPDGAFRFSTSDDGPIAIRAWPWKSPPSQAKTFECGIGVRFKDVVLALPVRDPDIAGTLVDASGAPVPLAFIDIKPLDVVTIGQQERADVNGAWEVYEMPPGRYQLTATMPGRGIVVAEIHAPIANVRLALGGTGRIAGTTTRISNGSFEIRFDSCSDALTSANKPLPVAHDPHLVRVIGGRFAIDDVPACQLSFTVHWRGIELKSNADVTARQTANIELDLGPPRPKTVHGVVRDADEQPIHHARVTASLDGKDSDQTSTDSDGRFVLHVFGGSTIIAGNGDHTSTAQVGTANVSDEQIDLVLASRDAQ